MSETTATTSEAGPTLVDEKAEGRLSENKSSSSVDTNITSSSASTETPSVEANGSSSSSSSSSSSAFSEEVIAQKMEKGKALCNEDKFAEAADLFAEVLEIKIQQYGELALECAESYYLYGRTLFLQAKSESSVFTPKKVEEESEDEESGDESEQQLEGENAGGEEGKTIEKQEEVENTQVAWETLEVARLIYERYPEKAPELSDTKYALAEIFLETDSCNEAIEEFKSCITLREQIFPPNDRRIAEAYHNLHFNDLSLLLPLIFPLLICLTLITHYHCGLAYFSDNRPTEAHFHYSRAVDVLSSKLNSLSPNSEETADIKAILQDLAAKMEEVDPTLLQKEATKPTTELPEAADANGKGKAVALPKEEIGFAPPVFDHKTQPVMKFGVVGSSVKRNVAVTTSTTTTASSTSVPSSSNPSQATPSTSASSSSSSSSSSSASRPLSTSGEKRKLEDIMGGEEGFEKRTKTSATVCNDST